MATEKNPYDRIPEEISNVVSLAPVEESELDATFEVADDGGVIVDFAGEEFTGMLTNAESGETVGDISEQYWKTYGAYPPVELFGYNKNSNAQARDVAASLDEARSKGALQGISMMMGFGMTTIPSIISAGYTLDEGITKTDNVFSKGISQLKEAVSPLLPDFLTDKETVDLSDLPSEAYIPYGKEEEIDKSFLEPCRS